MFVSLGRWRKHKSSLATEAPQSWHVARFGANEVTTTVVVTFAGEEIRFSLFYSQFLANMCDGSTQMSHVHNQVSQHTTRFRTRRRIIICIQECYFYSPRAIRLSTAPAFFATVLTTDETREGGISEQGYPTPKLSRCRCQRQHCWKCRNPLLSNSSGHPGMLLPSLLEGLVLLGWVKLFVPCNARGC